MRTVSYTIETRFEGAKVKDVLQKQLLVSDALCSRLKRRENGILLNGVNVYVTHAVHAGDVLTAAVGDAGKDLRIVPMETPLDFVYEDADILILNKPAGLAVHPARDPKEITLENALAAYLGADENPHPVSRLDRGTTGLLTVAKSGWAHSWMKTLQHANGLEKAYLALVKGVPSPACGRITAPIGLSEGSSYRRAVREDGAPSDSEYAVLQSFGDLSLVRLIPRTGRTHQLRLHMAYIGHPVAGDDVYGNGKPASLCGQCLHAKHIGFTHPITGEWLEFESELPEYFTKFLKSLR